MSAAELTFFWADDEADATAPGLLTAEVKAGGYAGHGSAWFRPDFIRKSFIEEVRRHPISKPIDLGAGPDQKTLRLRISPRDETGLLLVELWLSAPAQSEHPLGGLENELTVRFVTNHEALSRFAAGLEAQLDGGDIPSILTGT